MCVCVLIFVDNILGICLYINANHNLVPIIIKLDSEAKNPNTAMGIAAREKELDRKKIIITSKATFSTPTSVWLCYLFV